MHVLCVCVLYGCVGKINENSTEKVTSLVCCLNIGLRPVAASKTKLTFHLHTMRYYY